MAAMQEEFFADTALIGIATALPGYRLCWLLNSRLNMCFVRDVDSDICIRSNDGEPRYFAIYKYYRPLNGNTHLIYKLKTDEDILLPEIRQLDYLWMIQSTTPDADAAILTRYLREMPEIQLAQMLQAERMKNLSYLLV